ncbi:hypothetical protein AB0M19_01665 [Streptomyces sp. NPDC051920]|uniref:hypothetical protein n=1 Tax=Streptomyces sp. NPDC051920 TaxID=3155523 RepID=UPI003418A933
MSTAPFAQSPTKFCSACGTVTETIKDFCPECGTTFGKPAGGGSVGFVPGAAACAAVSVFFFPIVLGPLAIVLSVVAMNRREPYAGLILGLSVAGMVVGFILGATSAIG